MDINLLIWSYLIVFMLHNFEEIILIERWFNKTYPTIKGRIPKFLRKEVEPFSSMTAARFALVVGLLFIPVSALIFITVTTDQYFIFLGLNIVLALNIFTHPLQSFLLKSYVPGLWTTLFIIIPYNIIVFYQLYHQGILNFATNIKALAIIILFIPVFMISHKMAEKWI